MNVAKDASVLLRRIADADVASIGVGSSTFHKCSNLSLPWCNTVRPSLVICTSSFVNVATHPLLHGSDMLTSDVSRDASGNMCAVSGTER